MVLLKQIRFCDNKKDKQLRQYYTSGNYIDYITRPQALINDQNFINLNTLTVINKTEKGLLKEKLNNLDDKQLIWDFVVSFDNDFCKKNAIYNANDFSKAIVPALEKLFEKNHMKMEDLEIFGALHQNTDNLHMHIGFFEKKELYVNIKGNKTFKRVGALGGENVNNFKEFGADVEKFVVDDKLYSQLKDYRKQLQDSLNLKQNIKPDLYVETINHFAKNEINDFQFNKLDEETKNKIIDLTNNLISNDSELKEQYEGYKNVLNNLYELKRERIEKYDLNYSSDLDNWYKLQEEDIDVRNCNSILKSIKQDLIFNKKLNKNSNKQEVKDLEKMNIQNLEKPNQEILNNVKIELNKNCVSQFKKVKHISNNNKNINFKKDFFKNIKPHKNINAYCDVKFQSNKAKKLIKDVLNENMKLALKMFHIAKKEFEYKKELEQKIYQKEKERF